MRYVTEAEKKREQERVRDRAERLRWMTLVEAVKYVKDRQHCGDQEALEDVLYAIADRKVRALSGDISYEEGSLAGYQPLSRSELQREVKVCLDGPGFIDLPPSKTVEAFEYPKVTIVEGRIGKVVYPKSHPFSAPVLPEVDELEHGPVLVFRDDLEKWPFAPKEESAESTAPSSEAAATSVPDAASTARQRRGRPSGSGSWADADAPLVDKMRELIEAGNAKSPNDAASKVAREARGSGTVESKITRLAKRYRAQQSPDRK